MPSEGYLIVEFISEVCKADCQDSCGPHTVFGTGSSGHSLGKVTSEDSGMNGKRSTDGCLLSGLPPARLYVSWEKNLFPFSLQQRRRQNLNTLRTQ